jgi:Holliday junction resolvase RusA-like endonuclease
MTQRSQYANPQAREYIESRNRLRDDMRTLMMVNRWQTIPRGVPLAVSVVVGWLRHNQDLDNIVKAVLDAANGVVYEDDCWIDMLVAQRATVASEPGVGLGVKVIGSGREPDWQTIAESHRMAGGAAM